MKINFNNGGFFQIKRVKWSENGELYMDYQILIESISDEMNF